MPEPSIRPKRARRISAPQNGEIPLGSAVADTEAMPGAAAQAAAPGPAVPKEPSIAELYSEFWQTMNGENPLSKYKELSVLVTRIISAAMAPYAIAKEYNWLIVHDPLTMMRTDTDKIYKAINEFKENKEIALIMTSGGGKIEPAYLISKLCRESTAGKFITIVPRRAKSAATLVCCGADEIHMGQMSELGPIDPQFDDLPALGLKDAVQHVAELASEYPKASEMFAKYLTSSLNLVHLGYYERLAESAVQYAEKLLQKRVLPLKGKPHDVAMQLVYGYKDHGFVIDGTEAENIFGEEMIQRGKDEYALGNSVYEWLSLIESACASANYGFYMYGQPSSDCNFYKKK